jgi:hypothetical protein
VVGVLTTNTGDGIVPQSPHPSPGVQLRGGNRQIRTTVPGVVLRGRQRYRGFGDVSFYQSAMLP